MNDTPSSAPNLLIAAGVLFLILLGAWFGLRGLPEPAPSPTPAPSRAAPPPSPTLTLAPPPPPPSPSPAAPAAPVLGGMGGAPGPAAPGGLVEVAGELSGRVLAPGGGPLGGARLELYATGERLLAEGHADAAGAFRLEVTWAEGPAQLRVRRAWEDGVARGQVWVRGGGLQEVEVQTTAGYDLTLALDPPLRHQTAIGRPGEEEVRVLPWEAPGPHPVLKGLAGGELWVAVLGVDEEGTWRAASASGVLGGGQPATWTLRAEPLREVRVRVRQGGRGVPAKVLVEAEPGGRFARFSTLRWSRGDFFEEPLEAPLPSVGAPTDLAGELAIRLPPGRWRVSALGPPESARAEALLEVPPGAGDPLAQVLELGAGATCEFGLEAPADGEVFLTGPRGAWVQPLGGGRWQVGGLRPEDRVRVAALVHESEAEDAGSLCGLLTLAPGQQGTLAWQPTARIRGRLLSEREGASAIGARDAGSARPGAGYALAWSLPSEQQERLWLGEAPGGALTNFERAPGSDALAYCDGEGRFFLGDLFPGSVELSLEGPDGLGETRSAELRPGQELQLDWR